MKVVTLGMSAPEFFKKGAGVAAYYGFSPVERFVKTTPSPISHPLIEKDAIAGKICSILSTSIANGRVAVKDPLLLYYTETGLTASRKSRLMRFGLTIVGSKESFAEALILRTALAMLEEIGVRDYTVHVNSIGDRDSAGRFAREVQQYLRKHIETLSAGERKTFKDDIFELLPLLCHTEHPLREGLPSALEFLSEGSRRHFREVLEYLETGDIPYLIDRHLLAHRDIYTQTLFEIRHHIEGETVLAARGGRLDEAPKRLWRTNVPAVGISIEFEAAGPRKLPPPAAARKPKVCFIQVGYNARLKSLFVIESLRKAHIPFFQPLGEEKLGEQLARAISLRIPYTIIMGQREALDGTVIVRNMNTHAQDTVSVTTLPDYLKKIAS